MYLTNSLPNYPFTDIANHPLALQIIEAADLSLLNGYPDKSFRPDKSVTRAEFVAMTNRCLGICGCASMPFTDVPADAWYSVEVEKALSIGYINGTSDTTFSPDDNITRGQVAVILSRIKGGTYTNCGYSDFSGVATWLKDGLGYAWASGVFDSICQKDEPFSPNEIMTRGECAAVITSFFKSFDRFPSFLTACEKSDKDVHTHTDSHVYCSVFGRNLFSSLANDYGTTVPFSALSKCIHLDLSESTNLSIVGQEVIESDENCAYIRITVRKETDGAASLIVRLKVSDSHAFAVSDAHKLLTFSFED